MLHKLETVSGEELWLVPRALLPDWKLLYCWIHVLYGIFVSWQTFHWLLVPQKKIVTISVDKQFCVAQNEQPFRSISFFSLNWYEILWSKKATGVNKSAELQVGLNSTYYSIHHLLKRTAFHIAINRGKILYFLSQEDIIIVFSQFSVFPIHFVQVRWSKVQKE